MNSADPALEAPRYRYTVLAMLVLVYTFNFIDRQIVGILAVPIKADLGLTDTQLGLMGGLAFALFYTLLGIPIALLADRRNRTVIVTVALVFWSAMTAVCGFAQNFWQLFLARLGVGVGEAGGVAPCYSLVADYFPPQQRARALAVYSFGVPIGSALGILFGGFIATHIDWRTAFIIVGAAGVLVAPIFKMVVREPKRGRFDAPQATPATPAGIGEVMRMLARKPSFWGLSFGAAASSMMGYGLFFWLPSFLVRSHGLSLLEASVFFGAILLFGGIAGLWLGGSLADRLGTARRRMYAYIPAAAFVATIPFYLFGVTSSSLVVAFFLLLVPTGLGLVWLGPVLSSIQHVVPPNMRTTASAIFLFINNLIGIGLGTVDARPAVRRSLGAFRRGFAALRDSRRHVVLSGRRGVVPALGTTPREGLGVTLGPRCVFSEDSLEASPQTDTMYPTSGGTRPLCTTRHVASAASGPFTRVTVSHALARVHERVQRGCDPPLVVARSPVLHALLDLRWRKEERRAWPGHLLCGRGRFVMTASDRHRMLQLVAEVRVDAGEHVAIARHVDRDDGRLGRQRCDVVVGNDLVVDAERAYERQVAGRRDADDFDAAA